MNETNIQKNEWSPQDQRKLFLLHLQYGNKWSIISTHLKNKSDNCIKNKFYSTQRKGFRKMNKYITNVRRKMFKSQATANKLIKPQFLTKLAAIADRNFQQKYEVKSKAIDISQNIQQKLIQLAQNLIDYQKNNQRDYTFEEALLLQILQFNRNCKKRKGKRKYKIQSKIDQQLLSQQPQLSEGQPIQDSKPSISKISQKKDNNVCPDLRVQKMQVKSEVQQQKVQVKNCQLNAHEGQNLKNDPQDELKPNEYMHLWDNFNTVYAVSVIETPTFSIASQLGSLAHIIDPSPYNDPISFNQAFLARMQGMNFQTSLLHSSRNSQTSFLRSRNFRQKQRNTTFIQKIPMISNSSQKSLLFNSAQLSKISESEIQERPQMGKKLSNSQNLQHQSSFSIQRPQNEKSLDPYQQSRSMNKNISAIEQQQCQQQLDPQNRKQTNV